MCGMPYALLVLHLCIVLIHDCKCVPVWRWNYDDNNDDFRLSIKHCFITNSHSPFAWPPVPLQYISNLHTRQMCRRRNLKTPSKHYLEMCFDLCVEHHSPRQHLSQSHILFFPTFRFPLTILPPPAVRKLMPMHTSVDRCQHIPASGELLSRWIHC